MMMILPLWTTFAALCSILYPASVASVVDAVDAVDGSLKDNGCYEIDGVQDDGLLYEPEHVMSRRDKWTHGAECAVSSEDADADAAAPTILQVVTMREAILGCNSFEKHLSPRFHTIFVLPHDFAMAMKMDEFVDNVTAEQSAGAHLFVLKGETGGEVLARRLGMQFLETELEPREGVRIQYLSSVNCDVHPLPPHHELFMPLDEMVFRMVEHLKLSQEYRKRGSYLETNYEDPYTREYRAKMKDVVAITPLLFQDVRDPTKVDKLHARDVFHWWPDGWTKKPKHLVEEGLPWLVDNSLSFEDHIVLFDIELLHKMKDDYFVYPKYFIESDGLVGRIANKNNMTLIRSHDLKAYLNFGLRPDEIDFPSYVDLDWVKAKNMNMGAAFRNPRQVTEDWDLTFKTSGIQNPKINSDGCVTFLGHYLNPATWLPSTFHRGAGVLQEPYNIFMMRGFLRCFGYVETGINKDHTGMLEFHIDGSFYGNRVLKILNSTMSEQVDWDKWTKILTFRHQAELFSLLLCGYEVEECSSISQAAFSMEERTLSFPVDSVLEDLPLNSNNFDLWGSWHRNVLRSPGEGGIA